jgi:hypothetical protein
VGTLIASLAGWVLLQTCSSSGEAIDDDMVAHSVWVRPSIVIAVRRETDECSKIYTSLNTNWYVKGTVEEIKAKLNAE